MSFITRDDEARATYGAWDAEFEGENDLLMLKCLRDMNQERPRTSKLMTNFTSMVQSSGMGKSRTVHETAKYVFTLPFNLRDPEEPSFYPLSDISVRKFFLKSELSTYETASMIRFPHFLEYLFSGVAAEVESMPVHETLRSLATAWREVMLDANQQTRKRIYDTAVEKANAIYDAAKDDEEGPVLRARESLKALLKIIASKCKETPEERDLQLLIYFDEAHYLTETSCHAYNTVPSTAYKALCSALGELAEFDMMALFISKSPNLVKLTPPGREFWWPFGRQETYLQSPFTELPYLNADRDPIIEGGEDTTLSKFCSPEHIVNLSRPLFKTRYKFRRTGIFMFAKYKLCDGLQDEYGVYKPLAYTAVIATRVIIDIPTRDYNMNRLGRARETEATLVARHMRVVYSIPKHREFMRTGYPSDPLLAEVAAYVMNEDPSGTWEAFKKCLEDGLIGEDDRAMAIVRFLLVCSFDRARKWDKRELFSKPILLLDFLKALFEEEMYESYIKATVAHNIEAANNVPLEVAFENAFIYFTHFACARGKAIFSDVCALEALNRGMAWQFTIGEEEIDIMIPVVLKRGVDKPLRSCDLTFLAFRVRNSAFTNPVQHVELDEFFSNKTDGRPYIVAALNVGRKVDDAEPRISVSALSSDWVSEDASHPCYLFTVSGCDARSFGVLEGSSREHTFEEILRHRDGANNRDGALKNAAIGLRPSWTAAMCNELLKTVDD